MGLIRRDCQTVVVKKIEDLQVSALLIYNNVNKWKMLQSIEQSESTEEHLKAKAYCTFQNVIQKWGIHVYILHTTNA